MILCVKVNDALLLVYLAKTQNNKKNQFSEKFFSTKKVFFIQKIDYRKTEKRAKTIRIYSLLKIFQIYGYGCYCLNLGDRPLSGMMSGVVPVDDVDHMCFKWTKCNRCASMDHGDSCSAETTKYRFRINANTEDIICTGYQTHNSKDVF